MKVAETDYKKYAVVFYEAIFENRVYLECILYAKSSFQAFRDLPPSLIHGRGHQCNAPGSFLKFKLPIHGGNLSSDLPWEREVGPHSHVQQHVWSEPGVVAPNVSL